ncbi:MAG TPA: hypothetical protein VFB95_08085, partial [Candidatus Cryosericum sp.]|nr:hypothetical protein [Candidatus Cryosericum sp.]
MKPRVAVWLLGAALVAPILFITPATGAPARRLTFEERVAARRAVEEVYWRHRTWPQENRSPKPDLSSVLTPGQVRARVADDLRKSNALETFWRRAISSGLIQTELNRMADQTRDPRMLHELFAALGNDPRLIAETLARPALADRLIRSFYASDGRFHGRLRKRAEAALADCRSAACMRSLAGGEYRETTFLLER